MEGPLKQLWKKSEFSMERKIYVLYNPMKDCNFNFLFKTQYILLYLIISQQTLNLDRFLYGY